MSSLDLLGSLLAGADMTDAIRAPEPEPEPEQQPKRKKKRAGEKKDPKALMKAMKEAQNAQDAGSPRAAADAAGADRGASAYAHAHHAEVRRAAPRPRPAAGALSAARCVRRSGSSCGGSRRRRPSGCRRRLPRSCRRMCSRCSLALRRRRSRRAPPRLQRRSAQTPQWFPHRKLARLQRLFWRQAQAPPRPRTITVATGTEEVRLEMLDGLRNASFSFSSSRRMVVSSVAAVALGQGRRRLRWSRGCAKRPRS